MIIEHSECKSPNVTVTNHFYVVQLQDLMATYGEVTCE